ncbi:NAD-dependent epimerase/dehydratase family protein [Lacrimispora sp. 38-1]|uniref:NAD-dependent epimerase/dehydratase family protein n=1 Tax=Lacrimispora sp. 38-1 TaxID=3125778 RepID=UPI003CFB2AB4
MNHVIMTGATGFIGSWFVEELLNNDVKVTALVRDKSRVLKSIAANKNCKLIECDYDKLDEAEVDTSVQYDAFYHLGWGGVSPKSKNDVELQLSNIHASIKAMLFSSKLQCNKFIASGTVAEYVFCEDIMDVYEKQTPNDMYGAAKVSTHYFLEVLSRQLNQPFIWTVVPSTFGERRTDNNIISYTIRTLLNGEKPIYGDLNQMWDFLYVSEVARALRFIGESGIPGKTYGIGSGIYKPLKEYIFKIREVINSQAELGIGELPSMTKQTFSSCVNIYELIKDTGFTPNISFDDGIRKTVEWFKSEE